MRTISLALGLVLAVPAHAQDCESVVALSKVVATTVSDKESVDQHAANFCSEYSKSSGSSSNASFGASYKFLSASFGSSNASVEEVASKYCSASSSYTARSDAYRQYIESISPNAYSAYEQCLRMTKNDLKFNLNLASVLPDEFSMSIGFTSSVSGASKAKLTYSPSKGVNCKWDGVNSNTRSITLDSGSSALLECSRSDQTKRAYVAVIRNDAVSEPLTIPWQAYTIDGIPVDTLAVLQNAITKLQGRLDGVDSEIEQQAKQVSALKGNLPDRIELTECANANENWLRSEKDQRWIACPGDKVAVATNSRLDSNDGHPEYNLRCCRVVLRHQ